VRAPWPCVAHYHSLNTLLFLIKKILPDRSYPLPAIASPYQPAAVSQSLCLRLGLLDGHPVLYTLHTVYIVGEFGGQVQFVCVAGLDLPPFLYPMDDGIS